MKEDKIRRIWKGFWQLADIKIWIASTIPMLVSFFISYPKSDSRSIIWFIVAIVGIYLIEIAKNGANELVDYNSGVDRNIPKENRTPFSGGKKTIVQNKLTYNEVLSITVICYLLSMLIGVIIMFFREFDVLWIGLLGILLSLFYSVPPFKLCYKGWGELTVGITFGPLIMIGTQLIMIHSIDIKVILVSIPLGLLITNVLWINQYPDYEVDKTGNKRNWVVRMGREKGVLVYKILFMLTYISFFIITIIYSNLLWLLPLVTIPLAFQSIKNAEENFDNITQLVFSNARTIQIYQLVGIIIVVVCITSYYI